MRVVWSVNAAEGAAHNAAYIRREFGNVAKQRFLAEVRAAVALLRKNPGIGAPEPLLEDAPVLYRGYIVNGLNKLVYYVHDNVLEIVAFWDTRLEPEAQVGFLK